jgi:hypothetical protein
MQCLCETEKRPAIIWVASKILPRGESDEAFKWLDRAYEQKDALLYRLKFSPEFDGVHGDPRYKAFLKKMNWAE